MYCGVCVCEERFSKRDRDISVRDSPFEERTSKSQSPGWRNAKQVAISALGRAAPEWRSLRDVVVISFFFFYCKMSPEVTHPQLIFTLTALTEIKSASNKKVRKRKPLLSDRCTSCGLSFEHTTEIRRGPLG